MSEPVEPEGSPEGEPIVPAEDVGDSANDGPDAESRGYNTSKALPALAGWSEMAKKSESITDAFLALYPKFDANGLKVPQLPASVVEALRRSESPTNAFTADFGTLAGVNTKSYEEMISPPRNSMVQIMVGTNELLADLVAHGEAAALDAARLKRTETWRFWVTLFFVVVGSAAAVWGVLHQAR